MDFKNDSDIIGDFERLLKLWKKLNFKNVPKVDKPHITNFNVALNNLGELIEKEQFNTLVDKGVNEELHKIINEQRSEIDDLKSQLGGQTRQQHGRKSVLTDEQHIDIREMRNNGESLRSIAKKIGVSAGTIRNSLKRQDNR